MFYLLAVGVIAMGIFYLLRTEQVVDRLRANGRLSDRTPRAVQVVAWRVFGALGLLIGAAVVVFAATSN